MFKKTAKFILTAALMITAAMGAFAAISSEADLYSKVSALEELYNKDLSDFVNKSELIGDKRQSFNMYASQYRSEIKAAQENMYRILQQIELVKNTDMNETDRFMQINKLCQEAEANLYSIDSRTMNYLYSINYFMPTLTYQKYAKKFGNYYNSLNITDADISVK